MYDYEHMRYKSRIACLEDIDKLKDIAKNYGVVRVADYNNIIGIKSEFTDNEYGWFEHMIENTTIGRDRCGYFVYLPKPINIYVDENVTNGSQSDPQPICITIHTNEISDLSKTLAETFKYIYTIQDRTVNLSIM